MIVSLTGFMGCGKSTVGRALAEKLGWEFVDLDAYVEHKKGFSIREIFEREGEESFRAVESECIRDIIVMHQIAGGDVVIALGGGTLSIHSVQPIILEQTVCIWLRRSLRSCLEEIAGEEDSRPLLRSIPAAETLFVSREADYSKAGIIIDCDGKTYDRITEEAFSSIKASR